MNPNLIAERGSIGISDIIEATIRRSCIVDFGIVTEVPEDTEGIVTVAVAVSNTPQDIQLMTCVLANIASSEITVKIKPTVGDKVLVVYPRLYDEDMFTVPDADIEKTKIIVNEQARGYNMTAGIAFLFNQYKEASHHNIIDFSDGNLSVKLAYSKNDEKNLLTFDTNKDGEISFDSNGNTVELNTKGELSAKLAYDSENDKHLLKIDTDKDGAVTLDSNNNKAMIDKDGAFTASNSKGNVVMDKDGYLSYKNTDSNDNKTQLVFTSSGMTLQDKNSNKITSSNSGMTIQDTNGCTIETKDSGTNGKVVVLNGKLTVKK